MIDFESLKSAVDLHGVVEQYVKLKKVGDRWIGKCPFHEEKTASFSVWPDHYHCFGCGANGDAVDFVQKIEGISVKDAVDRLGGAPDVAERRRLIKQADAIHAWDAKVVAQLRSCLLYLCDQERAILRTGDGMREMDTILDFSADVETYLDLWTSLQIQTIRGYYEYWKVTRHHHEDLDRLFSLVGCVAKAADKHHSKLRARALVPDVPPCPDEPTIVRDEALLAEMRKYGHNRQG